ncbi:hypothetical protein [Streptomyces sp. NPDC049906]|uniref:hypothetical protein n=1 Tax=Streptomyces sp. NPDC049906 TaxID=3155656 RepID=UPI003446B4D8
MSAARRSLLTATAAGTLLGALWFIPSANATSTDSLGAPRTIAHAAIRAEGSEPASAVVTTVSEQSVRTSDSGARLADTGSFDTTPYVYGGAAFLCVGAGFVAYSMRRGRTEG